MAKIIEFNPNYKKPKSGPEPENEKPNVIEMKPRRAVESSDDDLLYFEEKIYQVIEALERINRNLGLIFTRQCDTTDVLNLEIKNWEGKTIRELVDAVLNGNPYLYNKYPIKYYALVKILEEKISYYYDLKKE